MTSAAPAQILSSPNHGKRRTRTLRIILHSTRSGLAGRAEEYGRTTAYMLQADTVSSHRVIGIVEGQHCQLVEDDVIAFHAAEDNATALGAEFCQPRPTDQYSAWQIETGIAVVVGWCHRYGLVPNDSTIVRHSETAQGRLAGKSDPGSLFPMDDVIAQVRRRMGYP